MNDPLNDLIMPIKVVVIYFLLRQDNSVKNLMESLVREHPNLSQIEVREDVLLNLLTKFNNCIDPFAELREIDQSILISVKHQEAIFERN